MKSLLFMLVSFTLCSCLLAEEHITEKKKPYPKTINQAVDIAISRLDNESKNQISKTYEGSMASYHFGWGMGLRNSLPIWGNDELISSAGNKHPDIISGEIMEQVRVKLHTTLSNAEKNRIQQFMDFSKQSIAPNIPPGSWSEMEEALNQFISSQSTDEISLYLLKFSGNLEQQTFFSGEIKKLTLNRILEFIIGGKVATAYFSGDYLLIEFD